MGELGTAGPAASVSPDRRDVGEEDVGSFSPSRGSVSAGCGVVEVPSSPGAALLWGHTVHLCIPLACSKPAWVFHIAL